jgi:hypothetical protein
LSGCRGRPVPRPAAGGCGPEVTAGSRCRWPTGPSQVQAHGSEFPHGSIQVPTADDSEGPQTTGQLTPMSTGEHRGLLSRDGIPLGSIRLTLNRVRGCWSGASVTDERPWRAARPGTDAAALSFRASVSAVAQASPRLRPTHSTRSSSAPAASSLTMNRLTWASSRTPRSLSWVRRRPHACTHADTGTTLCGNLR